MENYLNLAKFACCLAGIKFILVYYLFFQVSRHMLLVIIIYTFHAGCEVLYRGFQI